MPDLRWQPGDVGCTDLVDGDGTIRGWIEPISSGWRGYVIVLPVSARKPTPTAIRLTPGAARAWVESRVRGLRETSGGGDA